MLTTLRYFVIALKLYLQKTFEERLFWTWLQVLFFIFIFPCVGIVILMYGSELVELLFPTSVTPDLVESITDAVTDQTFWTWKKIFAYNICLGTSVCLTIFGLDPYVSVRCGLIVLKVVLYFIGS